MMADGLVATGQIALAFILMALVGRLALAGRHGLAVQTMAGWGILCLLLTAWGLLVPLSLRIPGYGYLLVALAAIPLTRQHPWQEDLAEAGRLLALALPLLAVLAPMQASQLDVFALILPNTAYLYDHGVFPTALGPLAHSDAPLAPYNTEMVPFLGSLLGGGFKAAGIAQFTTWLHLPAALLLGRCLADGRRPGWGMAAFGLLLATVINPGFVPRVSFAGYGEAPLAICLMFALWLGARVLEEKEKEKPELLLPLALSLAALVNVKQQGIGLFVSLGGAGMLVAALRPAGTRWPTFRRLMLAALPALLLYAAWKAHVLIRFPDGELKSDMAGAWRDSRITAILGSMAWVAKNKLYQFGLFAAVITLAVIPPSRLRPVTRTYLRLCAITMVIFNLFLVVTYLLHFGKEHSYFRYNSQLSLAALLGAVLVAIDLLRGRTRPPQWQARTVSTLSIAVMLALPPAARILLRFDQDQPQPQLRFLARNLAAAIAPDARIALILPGDNSTSGMALDSLLRNEKPRRPQIDVLHVPTPAPTTLDEVASEGFNLALVSCIDTAPMSLGLHLPPRSAVLLRRENGAWSPVTSWTYPPVGKRGKWGWTNFIAEEPFCMGSD